MNRSRLWPKLSLEVLDENRWQCASCGAHRWRNDLAMCTHHIYPIKQFPEYELDRDNLVALCRACHDSLHYVLRHHGLKLLVMAAIDGPDARIHFGAAPHQFELGIDAANEDSWRQPDVI